MSWWAQEPGPVRVAALGIIICVASHAWSAAATKGTHPRRPAAVQQPARYDTTNIRVLRDMERSNGAIGYPASRSADDLSLTRHGNAPPPTRSPAMRTLRLTYLAGSMTDLLRRNHVGLFGGHAAAAINPSSSRRRRHDRLMI